MLASARGWKIRQQNWVTARRSGVGGAVEVSLRKTTLSKARGFARPCIARGAPDGQDQHSVRIMGQRPCVTRRSACPANHRYMVSGLVRERRVPLPVEPNGASLDAQEFFRNKGDASASS